MPLETRVLTLYHWLIFILTFAKRALFSDIFRTYSAQFFGEGGFPSSACLAVYSGRKLTSTLYPVVTLASRSALAASKSSQNVWWSNTKLEELA